MVGPKHPSGAVRGREGGVKGVKSVRKLRESHFLRSEELLACVHACWRFPGLPPPRCGSNEGLLTPARLFGGRHPPRPKHLLRFLSLLSLRLHCGVLFLKDPSTRNVFL